MHGEKARRHRAILEIIRREVISNQAELRRKLKERGFAVTQATLSRDLRELGVGKQVTPDGHYQYALSGRDLGTPMFTWRASGNVVVLKTETGLAPRVAYRIDALGLPEILGTVAGDDTVLVVIEQGLSAEPVMQKVWERLEA
ncbi:MAG: arginine repressor [Acidobacteriota bacterium]